MYITPSTSLAFFAHQCVLACDGVGESLSKRGKEREGENGRGGKERGKLLSGRVMGFVWIFLVRSWRWDDGGHGRLVDFSTICFEIFSLF